MTNIKLALEDKSISETPMNRKSEIATPEARIDLEARIE